MQVYELILTRGSQTMFRYAREGDLSIKLFQTAMEAEGWSTANQLIAVPPDYSPEDLTSFLEAFAHRFYDKGLAR